MEKMFLLRLQGARYALALAGTTRTLQRCLAPISAQNPVQTDENRVQDFVLIRNEMTQMQASFAEISRKLGHESATVNSTSNPTYTVSATAELASLVAAP